MEMDFLQEKPKLILEYPHKSKFNRLGFLSMIALSIMVLWVLKRLMAFNSVFSNEIIIAIVLFTSPLPLWFLGYHHFISGVKLEVYENNLIKYYTYGSRGNSLLQLTCKLQDIEEITVKERYYDCSKLKLNIRNPIFHGMRDKKLKRLTKVTIIADRNMAREFIQEWENGKIESLRF